MNAIRPKPLEGNSMLTDIRYILSLVGWIPTYLLEDMLM